MFPLSFFRNLTRPSKRRPTIFKQKKRDRKREKIERLPPLGTLSDTTRLAAIHLHPISLGNSECLYLGLQVKEQSTKYPTIDNEKLS